MQISRRFFMAGAISSAAVPEIANAESAPEFFFSHWEARQAIINARSIAEGVGGLALIGDSLSEVMWWPELAGKRTVNLGLGGARVRQMLHYIPPILERAKPDHAIIMASVNNAIGGLAEEEHASFPDEFRRLIQVVKTSVKSAAVMTVTPVELGKSLSHIYQNERVITVNNSVKSVSEEEGLKVYDVYGPVSRIENVTFDGVHLNAEPYKIIRDIYEAAAAAL